MLCVPNSRNNAWTKRSCWIEAATSVVHSDQLCYEQSKANTYGSHEGSFVLLVCQHVNCEDQFCGQDGLNLVMVSDTAM